MNNEENLNTTQYRIWWNTENGTENCIDIWADTPEKAEYLWKDRWIGSRSTYTNFNLVSLGSKTEQSVGAWVSWIFVIGLFLVFRSSMHGSFFFKEII